MCLPSPCTMILNPANRPRTGLVVGASLVTVGLLAWQLTRQAPRHHLQLTQVTFDTGFSTSPAISTDGALLAYASDRDGAANLDLYVQRFPGDSPRRLTATPADESEPAFSPDGSTLAFTSTRDGGGIYAIAVSGGDARLLARGGRTPRYAPDGRSLAYWKAGEDGAATGYVTAALGGVPRQIQPAWASVRAPSFSPDGKWLLFRGEAPAIPPAQTAIGHLGGLRRGRYARVHRNPSADRPSRSLRGRHR